MNSKQLAIENLRIENKAELTVLNRDSEWSCDVLSEPALPHNSARFETDIAHAECSTYVDIVPVVETILCRGLRMDYETVGFEVSISHSTSEKPLSTGLQKSINDAFDLAETMMANIERLAAA